jgi:hypothetical protein
MPPFSKTDQPTKEAAQRGSQHTHCEVLAELFNDFVEGTLLHASTLP